MIPFEGPQGAIEATRAIKLEKYSQLLPELKRLGYKVLVEALVVSSLGAWDPDNAKLLSALGIKRRYGRLMARLSISESLAWSRDIYVYHTTGQNYWGQR